MSVRACASRVIQSQGLMHMSIRRAKPMLALIIIEVHRLEATAVIASQAMPPVARTYSDDSSEGRAHMLGLYNSSILDMQLEL